MTDVLVAVPRRADNGHRDQVWSWVRDRWADQHPDWTVVEGHHNEGPFNRSAAINVAADRAWDVMLIADSDSFVAAEQANRGVDMAASTGRVTFAYDRFAYLNHEMTSWIMDGYDGNWWPGVEWTMTGTCSSMVAVPRKLWDRCGGADEGFVGWGGEDVALSLMLQTYGEGMNRIPGEVWHLWHPPAPHTSDDLWPGRLEQYAAAAYDKRKMTMLIKKLRAES